MDDQCSRLRGNRTREKGSLMFRRPQCLLLLTTLGSLCGAVVAAVLPQIAKQHLHASPGLLGCYGFAHSFLYVFSAWGSGRLADRFGHRIVLTLAFVLLAVGFASSLVTLRPLLFFIPFGVTGLAFGAVWPSIESAFIEGQGPGQMKRATGYFNYCWLGVLATGGVIGSEVYEKNLFVPLWSAVGMAAAMAALVNIPRALEIVPWGKESLLGRGDRVPAATRRLFIKLALMANLVSYFLIANLRALLPEYTENPLVHITGWRYGLLVSGITIGMFLSNTILMRWHRWHYSLRYLVGVESAAAVFLVVFVMSDWYPLLVALTVLMGFPAGLIYFSSLFYGMELSEKKGAHGGNHEGLIGVGSAAGPLMGGWVIALCQGAGAGFAARGNLFLCAALFAAVALTQVLLTLRAARAGRTSGVGADAS